MIWEEFEADGAVEGLQTVEFEVNLSILHQETVLAHGYFGLALYSNILLVSQEQNINYKK